MMRGMRKKTRALLAAGIATLAVGIGVLWFSGRYFLVEWRAYPRNAAQLDLRGTGISAEHYDAVRARLPECETRWDVPFQGGYYPNDTAELTIRSLSEEEIGQLAYLQELRTVHAEDCGDYALLVKLQEAHPGCRVYYNVPVDGTPYPQDAAEVTVTGLTDADVEHLGYLPQVTAVHADGCRNYEQLMTLHRRHPEWEISYQVDIGGEDYGEDMQELTLENPNVAEISEKFAYFPELKTVTLLDMQTDAESLLHLRETYPGVNIQWQTELFGITLSSRDAEIDLSGAKVDSTGAVEQAMAYFPDAERVFLGKCSVDNETLAAFREEKRADYKVVWSVEVGALTVRTDDIWFMPGKYGKGLTEEQAYNLRYCEDMICIDVGHKPIRSCEWAAFMPNLKYLILADTGVTDISPLEGRDKLIYLEMFQTNVRDLTPLLTCTALEDLNLSYTYADPEPVMKMTWLKRLWWGGCEVSTEEAQQCLPDTQLCFLHHSSTGNGWREGQNYYDMRDILGMYYMQG